MLQQFVIIYVNVVHHFNFARKPDKKSQSRREFLLQSWNKKATQNFTSLQFFLLRMSIFHSWSVFVSALEHHFISQLSKVSNLRLPLKHLSLFVDHSNPTFFVVLSSGTLCVYQRAVFSGRQWETQALFTLICFPLFAFLLKDCLLFDFPTFFLTT